MLGVLMASARDGQTRPTPGDVADVVRGSLLMRLRGPRGGWASALAAFALLAPLLLVLTDILLVAVPYWESQATWEDRIRSIKAVTPAGTALAPDLLERFHDGGIQLLSQPSFLILAGGQVIVAAAVLAGLRRTALVALLVAAVVDWHWVHWINFGLAPGRLATTLLIYAVFLLEAFALAVTDPRAARRLVTWRHAVIFSHKLDRADHVDRVGAVPAVAVGGLLERGLDCAQGRNPSRGARVVLLPVTNGYCGCAIVARDGGFGVGGRSGDGRT
jgi:hypothetical protein